MLTDTQHIADKPYDMWIISESVTVSVEASLVPLARVRIRERVS